MSRILCHSVFDIFTLLDFLQRIEYTLENQVIGCACFLIAKELN